MTKTLRDYYIELYGDGDISNYRWNQLVEIIEKAKQERSAELRKEDQKGSGWYLSEKMAGIMLYIDKFSDNLKNFETKIEYLADLGITYVHFMPLLKSREGNNDGGYAVSDYLSVDSRLGTMKQFERVIKQLKKEIRITMTCILCLTAERYRISMRKL